jgi:aryl-alcohol dehydrogenase-like predicted oxidoreductase
VLRKGDALEALIKARDAGKVRHVGYSGDNDAAAWAAARPDIAVIQTSINICDQRNIEAVLPICREHDVGVMAKRPIANAAWRNLDDQPGMYKNYAKAYTERLKAMNISPADLGFDGEPNALWPGIALRFSVFQPGVHVAIVGTTNPKNVEANIKAIEEGPLPDDVCEKLSGAFLTAERHQKAHWPGQT